MAVEAARRVVQEDLRSVAFETIEDVDVTSSFHKMGFAKAFCVEFTLTVCLVVDCSVCKLNFNG